jgi:hypothetical protein
MVFIKHAAVLDQLCKHKQAIADWSTSNPALCNVQIRSSQSFRPTLGPGWLPSPLLAANRAGRYRGGFPIEQSLPLQERISQSDATWHEELDKAQRLTIHAEF